VYVFHTKKGIEQVCSTDSTQRMERCHLTSEVTGSKRWLKKLSAMVGSASCLTDIFFPFFGGGISCKCATRVDSKEFKQLENWKRSWEDTSLMVIIDSSSEPVRRFPISDQHAQMTRSTGLRKLESERKDTLKFHGPSKKPSQDDWMTC
jgi:hypothetical protein